MNPRMLADQLEIIDIQDGLIETRDRSYVLVLETTSVNLDLKSEAEADVLITHYQHLLQSLTTPVQILIQTRAVDMDAQYEAIQARIDSSTSSTQKQLLEDYRDFLSQLVVGRNMLTRRFFLILRTTSKGDFDQAKELLLGQKEQIVRLLQPLEIKAHQLDRVALAQMLYSSFQPGKSKVQPLHEEVWS